MNNDFDSLPLWKKIVFGTLAVLLVCCGGIAF